MDRKKLVVILLAAALILFGGGYKLACISNNNDLPAQGDFIDAVEENQNEVNDSGAAGENSEKPRPKIMVHVVGAVKNPGVHELLQGARVVDAVEAAVPLKSARLDLLNLAAPLPDGTQVKVYSEEDYKKIKESGSCDIASVPLNQSQGVFSSAAGSGGGSININTASSSQLEELPGIGPVLAGKIIDYRKGSGKFLSKEDIKNVSGIGKKTYEEIKDEISVH
ncbi:MAG: helix-hairpin-helix domain-containing protein [Clostridiales bacterium]|nr:helix-hairpin-helix domain-containing protein [Clostridiales bacterium]MCF8022953.1 helix-hairpin-helix domain-containing protein [Clostridiales bacterium]